MNGRAKGLSAEALAESHPLSTLVEGWHFRVNEFSPGGYEAEGLDGFGHRVYRQGSDPEKLLVEIAGDARWIDGQRS